MKKLIIAVCLGLRAASAWADSGPAGAVGAGVVLGDPTGLNLKVFMKPTLAFDVGLGFSGQTTLYGDVLWHAWDLFPKPPQGALAGYLGFGPRLEPYNDTFGLRAIAGVSYWLPGHPVEVFVEAGPVFQLTPDATTDIDGGLGLRIYWGAPPAGRAR